MKKLTNEQLNEIVANDPRTEELVARLEEIEKAEQAINEALKNVDAYRDLKVHEIASICYDLEQTGIVSEYFFHNIVDNEYSQFCELEQTNASHVARNYIGRTSTFYYVPKESFGFLDEIDVIHGEYTPLSIFETLEYVLKFSQSALIKAARNKPCSNDELDAIHLEIDLDEKEFYEETELFDDVQFELDIVEHDLLIAKNFINDLEFITDFLDMYQTDENETYIVESYLTMHHEGDALNLVDVDLSTIHNDEIRKILEEMQHDVKREEQKLTRDEERHLFEDAGTIHVFNSVVEDYEFGELPEDHETGYRYFYSYPKDRTVYTDEKMFVFTNNGREYMDALTAALEDFDDEGLGIDEFTTFF